MESQLSNALREAERAAISMNSLSTRQNELDVANSAMQIELTQLHADRTGKTNS